MEVDSTIRKRRWCQFHRPWVWLVHQKNPSRSRVVVLWTISQGVQQDLGHIIVPGVPSVIGSTSLVDRPHIRSAKKRTTTRLFLRPSRPLPPPPTRLNGGCLDRILDRFGKGHIGHEDMVFGNTLRLDQGLFGCLTSYNAKKCNKIPQDEPKSFRKSLGRRSGCHHHEEGRGRGGDKGPVNQSSTTKYPPFTADFSPSCLVVSNRGIESGLRPGTGKQDIFLRAEVGAFLAANSHDGWWDDDCGGRK